MPLSTNAGGKLDFASFAALQCCQGVRILLNIVKVLVENAKFMIVELDCLRILCDFTKAN